MVDSDPCCEQIIIEKAEVQTYCFYCENQMKKHGDIFKCPVCNNTYKEKAIH